MFLSPRLNLSMINWIAKLSVKHCLLILEKWKFLVQPPNSVTFNNNRHCYFILKITKNKKKQIFGNLFPLAGFGQIKCFLALDFNKIWQSKTYQFNGNTWSVFVKPSGNGLVLDQFWFSSILLLVQYSFRS